MPITEPYSDFLSSFALTATGHNARMATKTTIAKDREEMSERARMGDGRDGRQQKVIFERNGEMAGRRTRSYNFSKRTRRNCHVASSTQGRMFPRLRSLNVHTWNTSRGLSFPHLSIPLHPGNFYISFEPLQTLGS